MTGFLTESSDSRASIRANSRRSFAVLMLTIFLPASVGCNLSRTMLAKSLMAGTVPSTQAAPLCQGPDCAAPTQQPVMTAMPVPQQPAAQVGMFQQMSPQQQSQYHPNQHPGAYPANGYPPNVNVTLQTGTLPPATIEPLPNQASQSGNSSATDPTNRRGDPDYQAMAHSMNMPAMSPEQLQAFHAFQAYQAFLSGRGMKSGQTMPAAPSPEAAEKLTQCEKQVEVMSRELETMKQWNETNTNNFLRLSIEQTRLQRDNEMLKRQAESTSRQYIESMDTLSNLISEVAPPVAQGDGPGLKANVPAANDNATQNAIVLPAVQ